MKKILKLSLVLLPLLALSVTGTVPQTHAASTVLTKQTKNVIQGTVVNVKQVPGLMRPNITWWAMDVQTATGTIEVRIAPTWWYPTLNIRKGIE